VNDAKAQLAIWAMLAAPMLMSNDLRHLHHDFRRLLLNRNVIQVNQDKLGLQGRQIITSQAKGVEVWARRVEPTAGSGESTQYSYAVAVWNKRTDGTPYAWSQPLSAYGLNNAEGYFVKDLFTNKDYGLFKPSDVVSFKVNPSGVVMLKATIANPAAEDSPRPRKLKVRKHKKVVIE